MKGHLEPGCNWCCDDRPADVCDDTGGLAGVLRFDDVPPTEQNARIAIVDSFGSELTFVRSQEFSTPLNCNETHVWSGLIAGGFSPCDVSGATLTSTPVVASRTAIPGDHSGFPNIGNPEFANTNICNTNNFTWEYDLSITGVAGVPAICAELNNSVVRVRPGQHVQDQVVDLTTHEAICPPEDGNCTEAGTKWPEQIIGTIAGVVVAVGGLNCGQFNRAFAMDVGFRQGRTWYQGEFEFSPTEWIVLTVEVNQVGTFLRVNVQKLQAGFAGGYSRAAWSDAVARTITCLDPSFMDVTAADFDLDDETIPGDDWNCDFSAATVSFTNVP